MARPQALAFAFVGSALLLALLVAGHAYALREMTYRPAIVGGVDWSNYYSDLNVTVIPYVVTAEPGDTLRIDKTATDHRCYWAPRTDGNNTTWMKTSCSTGRTPADASAELVLFDPRDMDAFVNATAGDGAAMPPVRRVPAQEVWAGAREFEVPASGELAFAFVLRQDNRTSEELGTRFFVPLGALRVGGRFVNMSASALPGSPPVTVWLCPPANEPIRYDFGGRGDNASKGPLVCASSTAYLHGVAFPTSAFFLLDADVIAQDAALDEAQAAFLLGEGGAGLATLALGAAWILARFRRPKADEGGPAESMLQLTRRARTYLDALRGFMLVVGGLLLVAGAAGTLVAGELVAGVAELAGTPGGPALAWVGVGLVYAALLATWLGHYVPLERERRRWARLAEPPLDL